LMQDGEAATGAPYQRYLERLQGLTARQWQGG